MTPSATYWHVWVDGEGVSHQSLHAIERFELKSVGGDAAPQFMHNGEPMQATVAFMVLPPGWVGDWHPNPKPQWVIPMSGRWYVETMDGTRAEMGPGELSLGEDQLAHKDALGRLGHLSGTVGDAPCVLLCVQLDIPPTADQPGRFR